MRSFTNELDHGFAERDGAPDWLVPTKLGLDLGGALAAA
jgi:hypothetical protein